MKIRLAGKGEAHRIVPLMREFFVESEYPGIFDPDRWVSQTEILLESDVGVILLLETDSGEVQGYLSGVILPDPLTGDLIAQESMWFVTRSARKGLPAIRLLGAFESLAKDRGCLRVLVGFLIRLTPERLERFYEGRGYAALEKGFVKNL